MNISERPRHGSKLDDLLKEDGLLEEFRGAAVKEIVAWQIQEAMTTKKLSKNKIELR